MAWKTGREPKFITIVSRGVFGGYVSYGDGEESNKILEEQMNCAMNLLEEGQQTLDRVACDVTKPRKWYVVLRGQKTGIYTTWEECAAQVRGYSNAVYSSFATEEEAKKVFAE